MLNLNKGVVASFLLGLFAHWSFGQSPEGDVDRAQWTRQSSGPVVDVGSPTGFENGQAVSTPNDSDMGTQQIVKKQPAYMPFTATAGTPVYYTSNAALTPHNVHADVITAPVVALYFEPRLANNLYAFADIREQIFYYGHYNNLDFGSLDVELGLSYTLPQLHNLLLRGEYDLNRLTFSDRVFDEFYTNHSLIFNAELPFPIGRNQQFAIGVDANISVAADFQSPRRNDYDAYIGYSLVLTREFSLSAAGRFVARDYHQNDRLDLSEIVSLTATYQLTPWWDVSAIGSFARNDSNHDAFDYTVGNVGGTMAFSLKF